MKYDVVVVGGGHAGIEAAHGAAKVGCSVLLITGNIDYIGEMPCNPSVGGVAKGNIVKEIDALGGLMGRLADMSGIQFRMLNRSKGVAVWGPRAQVDRFEYRRLAREMIEAIPNVDILQDYVTEVGTLSDGVSTVVTECGIRVETKAAVITTGTFLNGLAHIGEQQVVCGRKGEKASVGLSEKLREIGVKTGRLKTGTPARLDKDSIDYSGLLVQPGDENPVPFSYATDFELTNTINCWEVKTKVSTHDIIRANLHRSPMYGLGSVDGIGPRYCPSIEDKVVRFGDRNGHTLFLEPEGVNRREMYLSGFSTSLPVEVQFDMIHSLDGFEKAKIIKPAYAIEYDFFEPNQLLQTLESRAISGLYFAGQVNGTSGYEEAAGQGLVAGINAALKVKGLDPFIMGRDESYIGVLIDDLITKGTKEPYRMFTSRAEYRLLLRQDNADERLMEKGFNLGLIPESLLEKRKEQWEKKESLKKKITATSISVSLWEEVGQKPISQGTTAGRLIKRPEVSIFDLAKAGVFEQDQYDLALLESCEADMKYEGFVKKQLENVERLRRLENSKIPAWVDYDNIEGLLMESREKLKQIKPLTVGQASRISGVNPSDVSVLLVYLSQNNK